MTDERKEFILSVAKYFVLTGKSTRQLAEVFKVSNYTIHSILTNQLERLCLEEKRQDYFDLYSEVQSVLDVNKNNKTVDDIGIKARVLEATKLLLDGKKISEIAEILDSSFYTIYRDLVVRLPKIKDIDINLVNRVKQVMSQNKEFNLELGRKMPVDENRRDEKGKFV